MTLHAEPTRRERTERDGTAAKPNPSIATPVPRTGVGSAAAAGRTHERVGDRLARARAAQSMTIEELSSRVYIRPGILRGMERNDFAACGGDCYARGQLRIIAATLRLNEADLIAAFDRYDARDELVMASEGLRTPQSHRRPGRPIGRVAWVSLVILALLLVGVLLAGFLR